MSEGSLFESTETLLLFLTNGTLQVLSCMLHTASVTFVSRFKREKAANMQHCWHNKTRTGESVVRCDTNGIVPKGTNPLLPLMLGLFEENEPNST